jgi:hypothetical protein
MKGSVPAGERRRRADLLAALAMERLGGIYQKALSELRRSRRMLGGVLMESPCRGPDGSTKWVSGYTPNYLRALVRAPPRDAVKLRNRVVEVVPKAVAIDRAARAVAFVAADPD